MTTAFSFSRLTGYETCPRKFYKLSIAKTIKEPENEHTTYGTEVHLALKDYFKSGKPLPLHLRQHNALVQAIRKSPGTFVVEQQLAINTKYEPTGWFDKDVYCRVISDLTIMNPPKAVMFDWKTGKMYDDFTQLRLSGAVMFLLAPELEEIQLCYVWLKTRQLTKDKMHRDDAPKVWADLAPRLKRYQDAFDKQSWEPRAGPHCRWCPDVSCPFNEKKR